MKKFLKYIVSMVVLIGPPIMILIGLDMLNSYVKFQASGLRLILAKILCIILYYLCMSETNNKIHYYACKNIKKPIVEIHNKFLNLVKGGEN